MLRAPQIPLLRGLLLRQGIGIGGMRKEGGKRRDGFEFVVGIPSCFRGTRWEGARVERGAG